MKWLFFAIPVAIAGCGGSDGMQTGTQPTIVRQWAFKKYVLGQAVS